MADKLLEKIRFLTAEKEKVESSSRFLDFNWEGRKKEGFMHETNPHGKKIIDQIESYRAQERLFRSIKVNRREQYLNPEWESYQRGNR
ncbi:MAG: hypothetical protein JW929_10280 [Anaerolineales bacterium]|nr:hypothetical protein [Anaerolineales bacterium]